MLLIYKIKYIFQGFNPTGFKKNNYTCYQHAIRQQVYQINQPTSPKQPRQFYPRVIRPHERLSY